MSSAQIGISWTNSLPPEQYSSHQNLMNGSGVALGDYDGDGWCDIYLCNKFGPNALYRNLGNWKFENVTEKAGVSCTNQISTGAVFADFDGDGKLDLIVTSFRGPNALLKNNGNGTFSNVAQRMGLSPNGGCTSLALADLAGKGYLDLYISYFGIEAILRDGALFSTRSVGGKPVVTGRYARRLKIINGKVVEFGEPDMLYRYTGSQYTPLKWDDFFLDSNGQPAEPALDYGLAVQIRDANGDGLPDVYVCNDFHTPDRFWLNDGTGRFKAASPESVRVMSFASMGVDFADLDRDGNLEYFTVEMLSRERSRHLRQYSPREPKNRKVGDTLVTEDVARNTLFWNRGDNTYAEIAWYAGLAASDWSWTPIFIDLDLDGWEDLLISNGHLHDVNDRDMSATAPASENINQQENRRRLLSYPSLNTPNVAYRNLGNLRFQEMSDQWGFNSTQITQGMALADLDNDGDFDVVANCLDAAPLIYQNLTSKPRIAVRLAGLAPNTQGVGARITLSQGKFSQTQEILAGGRYLSGDDYERVFAVPDSTVTASLRVQWRSGKESRIEKVEPNCVYVIKEEGSAATGPIQKQAPQKPWFADQSSALNFIHHEIDFDDFQRQPTLPKKMSQLGPGVCWIDLDRNGTDDLVIGAGRGGRIATFLNKGDGTFQAANLDGPTLADDSAALICWARGEDRSVMFSIANYESTRGSGHSIYLKSLTSQVDLNSAHLPVPPSGSAGPLAMADIDGDGTLELFVGARFIPGKYPESSGGKLYRFRDDKWIEDMKISALLANAGMVSSAIFSDLDGDGFAELILACEWGPIRLFKNNQGIFADVTQSTGLDKWTGLWTSVTTGDLDGDGKMEIIAGNLGLNSFYNRAGDGPCFLYYADIQSNGVNTLIESYQEPGTREIVPFRPKESLTANWPELNSRFPRNADYAKAKLDMILGSEKPKFKRLEAATLASMLFRFKEGQWIPEVLPMQAQWAPAFGLTVADFNGDGHEDLFMAQNFAAVRPDDDRLDSGRGLLLRNDGHGKLLEVPGQESGIKIYGEQRGAATADYDRDGRIDLVVAQNGAAAKLYHNEAARPGLRIRLKGPQGNPLGFGAVVRVQNSNSAGPASELHCGSGYCSQDSAVLVRAAPEGASEIVVRWPGGRETRSPVESKFREVEIDQNGAVQVLK
jgi:hypothetical protein